MNISKHINNKIKLTSLTQPKEMAPNVPMYTLKTDQIEKKKIYIYIYIYIYIFSLLI